MNKYKDKNNREINLDVAVILGLSLAPISPQNGDGLIVYPHSNEVNFDPCNNPSDAWHIIVENKISIMFGSELSTAKCLSETEAFEVIDKNPLRAAMICFLKMKDAEVK